MKKKIETKIETTDYEPELSETTGTVLGETEAKKVSKIDYDFGRGDLNLMRDKINELIENGNK